MKFARKSSAVAFLTLSPMLLGIALAEQHGSSVSSRLLPGTFDNVVEHKIETPQSNCQAPLASQGLEYVGRSNLTAKQNIAAGSGMCLSQEFIYWNGESVNSTVPAVDSFYAWLDGISKMGGKIKWQSRVDASKLYLGITFKNRYYFVQFGNVSFDSILVITSTKYGLKGK